MRFKFATFCLIAFFLVGCDGNNQACNSDLAIVEEGIIWYVEYELGEGKSTGFTRSEHAIVLPSGGGGLKVDAYGKLTSDFLFITYPQRKDLGQHIIPVNRLLSIQFGDGSIKARGLN